jgi:hypothetical protein
MEIAPYIKLPPTLGDKKKLFKHYRKQLDSEHESWRPYYLSRKANHSFNGSFADFLSRLADEMVIAHLNALEKQQKSVEAHEEEC